MMVSSVEITTTACCPFIAFSFLQGVSFSAEVSGLLLKGLQRLPKTSKPFVHQLEFVIHKVTCNITGKLWWFCKVKEGGGQWIPRTGTSRFHTTQQSSFCTEIPGFQLGSLASRREMTLWFWSTSKSMWRGCFGGIKSSPFLLAHAPLPFPSRTQLSGAFLEVKSHQRLTFS